MSSRAEEIAQLIRAGGKYALGDQNNEGMNSYAFAARHVPLGREVFLKVYDADRSGGELFREPRYFVEVTKNRGASSNLVEVYDAETLGDDYVLLAMEYLKGGSILQRLSDGPFGLMDAIRIAIGLLHGVSDLHTAGLVHRDIKPANVLLSGAGMESIAKLGDFGSMARLPDPSGTVAASRHSALYVPPEGWSQPSRYGKRSDLYQVGMVLHEMVNGALPYNHEPYLDRAALLEIRSTGASSLTNVWDPVERCRIVERAIARRARERKLLSLVPSQPYVPIAVRRAIQRATSPNPDDRFQTASEFIGALSPLAAPNWHPAQGERPLTALHWNGWDWRVENGPRAGSIPFVVRRSRAGDDGYRSWKAASTIPEAVALVLNQGGA